jgi:uncharacterized protein YjbI with pentapeptide repeats
MADEEQLRILRQGVHTWNQWRQENQPSEINLSAANLAGLILVDANLSNANLSNANLSNANLVNADFQNTNLSNSLFNRANLIGANFTSAILEDTDFRGSNLISATFNKVNLEKIIIDNETRLNQKWDLVLNLLREGGIGRNISEKDLSGAHLSGIDFSGANLKGTDLSDTNMSDTNLSNTILYGTKLLDANLKGSNLSRAKIDGKTKISPKWRLVHFLVNEEVIDKEIIDKKDSDEEDIDEEFTAQKLSRINLSRKDLSGANLNGVNLSYADLSEAILDDANLSEANLKNVNFRNAELQRVNLSEANLRSADLRGANLYGANLKEAKVIDADFSEALLTAACLMDWHINRSTNLQEVEADYIYKGKFQNSGIGNCKFTDRRPCSGNFKPGEFAALFEQAFNAIDLVFIDGINWHAFFISFQELCQKYEDADIRIQAFEKRNTDSFIIRLETANYADISAIEQAAQSNYEKQLQIVKTQYKSDLKIKDIEIEHYRREKSSILAVVNSMTKSKPSPIFNNNNVTAMTQDNRQPVSFDGATIYGSGYTEGDTHNTFTFEQRQTITEAASEIQALLDQLSTTYPTDTITQRATLAEAAIVQAQSNPSLWGRILSAVNAGTIGAVTQALNHPAAAFFAEAIKDWNQKQP